MLRPMKALISSDGVPTPLGPYSPGLSVEGWVFLSGQGGLDPESGQIVSDEELLSLLYVKEVNLRERFEKIISELEKVQKDLVDHRGRAASGEGKKSGAEKPSAESPQGDAESFGDLRTAVAVAVASAASRPSSSCVACVSVRSSSTRL